MSRYSSQRLNFVAQFVDTLTVGAFYEDLRRIKAEGDVLRAFPRRTRTLRFDEAAEADAA